LHILTEGCLSEATALFTLDAITLYPGEEKIIDMRPTATGRTVIMCQVPFKQNNYCYTVITLIALVSQVAQNVRGGMLMAYTTLPS
jgi:hypothetical protein